MISDNYIATEFGGRVLNTRERGLPKVMAMIEVSCKTGYNIRELRQLIYKTSYEIKEKGRYLGREMKISFATALLSKGHCATVALLFLGHNWLNNETWFLIQKQQHSLKTKTRVTNLFLF